jgi:hypothetical protein
MAPGKRTRTPCLTAHSKRMFVSCPATGDKASSTPRRHATTPSPTKVPGLTWRQLAPRDWSGTWASKIRGTVTRDRDGWVAYLRLEDPPGLSPIATVGRFDTVEVAQVATGEAWGGAATQAPA